MFIVKGLSYITAKLVVIYDTNKEKAHYFNFMRFLLICMRIIEKGGLPIGKPPFISIPIYYIKVYQFKIR